MTPPTNSPSSCAEGAVDRWKSLLIVAPEIVVGARARNETNAPWSFRRRFVDLARAGDRADEVVYGWLASWKTTTEVMVDPKAQPPLMAAIAPRAGVDEALLCPWLRASATNGCNADCSACTNRRLDLAQAPFSLLAVVNRMDLGAHDRACSLDAGELRFVYTATSPGRNGPIAMTVGFEYAVTLLEGETRRDWANAWRALDGKTGAAYEDALAALVEASLARARLARVVTNEDAFGAASGLPWEMRQFTLVDEGTSRLPRLAPAALAHTPKASLNGDEALGTWILGHRDQVMRGDQVLAPELWAGAAPLTSPAFRWTAPRVDAVTLAAFNRNTCNGCHGGRSQADPLAFQHIAPPSASEGYYGAAALAPARLSRFLDAPGGDDELGRRARLLVGTACAPSCAGPGSRY